MDWADWQYKQPSNWNGADNGVLQVGEWFSHILRHSYEIFGSKKEQGVYPRRELTLRKSTPVTGFGYHLQGLDHRPSSSLSDWFLK